jgi:hypothetical protein
MSERCQSTLANVFLPAVKELGYHSVRCDLTAGHEGQHEADTRGGKLQWDDHTARPYEPKPGDVIQIHLHHRVLPGCFAQVDTVQLWGVTARVPVGSGGAAPVRLQRSEFQFVGRAAWVLAP